MFNQDLDNNDLINIRSLLYAIRNDLDLSMIDFNEYIEDNHTNVDCDNVKKNYLYVTIDNFDIVKYLTEYIKDRIEDTIGSPTEFKKYDLYSIIYDNIDIFVDITEKENDIYIIELAN